MWKTNRHLQYHLLDQAKVLSAYDQIPISEQQAQFGSQSTTNV
jgi:hypothetical protein